MICDRCKEERPLFYRVKSDILSQLVCMDCAVAARGLPGLEIIGVHFASPLLTAEGAYIIGQLLCTWVEFRNSHDLESFEITCCEKSKDFHNALRAFEAIMTGQNEKTHQ